jgi:hypothetical protein
MLTMKLNLTYFINFILYFKFNKKAIGHKKRFFFPITMHYNCLDQRFSNCGSRPLEGRESIFGGSREVLLIIQIVRNLFF